MSPPVSGHVLQTGRHRTAYLRCGDPGAPLAILVHGWPERAISWRHQLGFLASLGFCAVAPDMRGYGDSQLHTRHEDYAVEEAVADMIELLDALSAERAPGERNAVWVGHDWGSPVVWALASHHPERCVAVANLCVPYQPRGFTLESMMPLVDREIYPADRYPAGQWEYFHYYREHFNRACAVFEADAAATVRTLFRRGSPGGEKKPSRTAMTRIEGGWYGGATRAPDVPRDTSVLDDVSYATYVDGLSRNGFFGPNAWYMNDARNGTFAARARNGGRLDLPVLFVHARFDYTCYSLGSQLAAPMRAACTRLHEMVIDSGHWMAQEQPEDLNSALLHWMRREQLLPEPA